MHTAQATHLITAHAVRTAKGQFSQHPINSLLRRGEIRRYTAIGPLQIAFSGFSRVIVDPLARRMLEEIEEHPDVADVTSINLFHDLALHFGQYGLDLLFVEWPNDRAPSLLILASPELSARVVRQLGTAGRQIGSQRYEISLELKRHFVQEGF